MFVWMEQLNSKLYMEARPIRNYKNKCTTDKALSTRPCLSVGTLFNSEENLTRNLLGQKIEPKRTQNRG